MPSDATAGQGDGCIAVRVSWPDSPNLFRYGAAEGAPVAVQVFGSIETGLMLNPAWDPAFSAAGIIAISFVFQGGSDQGQTSAGTYDDRGDLSHRALRDVLQFAAGLRRDRDGRLLRDITGGRPRPDLLGIYGGSYGAATAVATLARYPAQVPPIAYFIASEPVSSDQVIAGDLPLSYYQDPDLEVDADGSGSKIDDAFNGALQGYGHPVMPIDYTRLRYSPTTTYNRTVAFTPVNRTGMFYFDNNGNQTFDAVAPGSWNGDVNGNGVIDPGEDFLVPGLPLSHDGRLVLSVPAVDRAEASGLAVPWPAHYLTPADTREFWRGRNAAALLPAALAAQPGMKGMSIYWRSDHALCDRGKAHVRHFADAFAASGRWFRLMPDRAYIEHATGAPQPSAPDIDANIAVTGSIAAATALPDSVAKNEPGFIAPVGEMADRTYYNYWMPNLPGVLTGVSNSQSWTLYE